MSSESALHRNKVRSDLLQLIDQTEEWIREKTGLDVVRCRVHQQEMRVEVENPSVMEKHHELIHNLRARVLGASNHINSVVIDQNLINLVELS